MLVIAAKKAEEFSDEEDTEDGLLNASMSSTSSSLAEANATMRYSGLANTVPLISPRDKRRKKESEVRYFFSFLWSLVYTSMYFVTTPVEITLIFVSRAV